MVLNISFAKIQLFCSVAIHCLPLCTFPYVSMIFDEIRTVPELIPNKQANVTVTDVTLKNFRVTTSPYRYIIN